MCILTILACEQAHLFGEFVSDNLGSCHLRAKSYCQDTHANNTLSEPAHRLSQYKRLYIMEVEACTQSGPREGEEMQSSR